MFQRMNNVKCTAQRLNEQRGLALHCSFSNNGLCSQAEALRVEIDVVNEGRSLLYRPE